MWRRTTSRPPRLPGSTQPGARGRTELTSRHRTRGAVPRTATRQRSGGADPARCCWPRCSCCWPHRRTRSAPCACPRRRRPASPAPCGPSRRPSRRRGHRDRRQDRGGADRHHRRRRQVERHRQAGGHLRRLDQRVQLPKDVVTTGEATADGEVRRDRAGADRAAHLVVRRRARARSTSSIQSSANGLRLGLLLALASVGLSLIYGTTGLSNFAHAEQVTLGGILGYASINQARPEPAGSAASWSSRSAPSPAGSRTG